MNFLVRRVLPLAAIIVTAAPLFADDAVELKQQFRVGKKYIQTMDMEQDTTISLGEQKMKQHMEMNMQMSMAVARHEDGQRKRLTVKYDRMSMQMDMNGQKMGYDSAKPDEDAMGMGKGISAFVGKEFRVLATDKDEITEVENLDEILGGAAAGPIGQMFNKESLVEMMKQASIKGLPNHPVKPGDTWDFAYDMKMASVGSVKVKGKYTLKNTAPHDGNPSAELAMDATLTFDSAAAAAPGDKSSPAAMMAALGMKISSGKIVGTIWFDPKLGSARETQIDQEMEISMNNPTKPDEKIVLPMKQKISQKLVRVEDAN